MVLFTLARRKIESKRISRARALDADAEPYDRFGRPPVLMQDSLEYADFALLCQLDYTTQNTFMAPDLRNSLVDFDRRLTALTRDSPLSALGVNPLEILARAAANSFAISKYDHFDEARAEKLGIHCSSGEATFPLASYFNHNCYPNCKVSFDMDANIVLCTTRDVPADTELTISYDAEKINASRSDTKEAEIEARQRCKSLCREIWSFECDCPL